MNLALIFLTGLTTGGISCLAMQLGLFTSALTSAKTSKVKALALFLSAKLTSHFILGLLLGAFGSLLSLSLNLQLFLQAVASLYLLASAASLLNLHPFFRYFVLRPPKIFFRYLKTITHQSDNLTPALLGFFTVLIPCGITQSMMLLAISSGDALTGGLTLLAYVLGTIPIFVAAGIGFDRLDHFSHQKASLLASFLLVMMGLYGLNGVLRVLDSPFSVQNWSRKLDQIAQNLAGVQTSKTAVTNNAYVKTEAGIQKVIIEIHDTGYEPNNFVVKAGLPVELKLITNNVYSCANSFTFKKYNLFTQLKATDEKTLTFTPQELGTFSFSCSMGMYGGTMTVI